MLYIGMGHLKKVGKVFLFFYIAISSYHNEFFHVDTDDLMYWNIYPMFYIDMAYHQNELCSLDDAID